MYPIQSYFFRSHFFLQDTTTYQFKLDMTQKRNTTTFLYIQNQWGRKKLEGLLYSHKSLFYSSSSEWFNKNKPVKSPFTPLFNSPKIHYHIPQMYDQFLFIVFCNSSSIFYSVWVGLTPHSQGSSQYIAYLQTSIYSTAVILMKDDIHNKG